MATTSCEVNAYPLRLNPNTKIYKYRIDFIADYEAKKRDLAKGPKNECVLALTDIRKLIL